jgi:hypothetical protein
LDEHAQKDITAMAPKFCRQVATINSYQKPFMRPSKKKFSNRWQLFSKDGIFGQYGRLWINTRKRTLQLWRQNFVGK